jgi:hypothetical protein
MMGTFSTRTIYVAYKELKLHDSREAHIKLTSKIYTRRNGIKSKYKKQLGRVQADYKDKNNRDYGIAPTSVPSNRMIVVNSLKTTVL